jgi:hypothetical protein
MGTHDCRYSAPVDSGAYYYLCLDANAQGGGLLTYGNGGTAPQKPMTMNINGQNFTFPQGFSVPMVLSSSYSVVHDNLFSTNFTVDTPLTDGGLNITRNTDTIAASINNQQLWANLDSVVYSVPGGDAAAGGAIISRYMSAVRTTPSPNVVIWAGISAVTDETGGSADASGGMITHEFDMAINGASSTNDGRTREILSLVLQKRNAGGADGHANNGIGVFGQSGATGGFDNAIMLLTAPYGHAGIDLTGASVMSGGSNNAIWVATGQAIALDTDGPTGSVYIKSSLSAFSTRVLEVPVSGMLFGPNTGTQFGPDATVTVLGSSLPLRVPSFATNALPPVAAGDFGAMAFDSDCRNTGEGSGTGSGCLVVRNHANSWVAVWSGVAPTT